MSDLNAIHLYEPRMATGDEKALLRTHLALAQNDLLWKLEGLTDEDLRRPMTRTSTNLIGIVKHLTGVTAGYLISNFGREREIFPWEDNLERRDRTGPVDPLRQTAAPQHVASALEPDAAVEPVGISRPPAT